MKIIYLSVIIIYLSAWNASAQSRTRSEAKNDIDIAQEAMSALEKNREIKSHIPHKRYYDAKVYLDTAVYQFSEERDYTNASYFAVMALVETEASIAVAKTRLIKKHQIELERDYYKKMYEGFGRRPMSIIAILKSGFFKSGPNYQRTILDSQIFVNEEFELKASGKKYLDAIADVLSLSPRSKLEIVGHTRDEDPENIRSLQKAESVAAYFKSVKGIVSRRLIVKGVGDSVEYQIHGNMRRIDRVELILKNYQ